MTAVEVAQPVLALTCEGCGTVYVIEPGERPDLRDVWGVQLLAEVWRDAEAKGWRATLRQRFRCGPCVEAVGLDPLPPRRGWRDLLYGDRPAASAGNPGAPPG